MACFLLKTMVFPSISIGFDPKHITALADQLRGGASLTLLSSLGLWLLARQPGVIAATKWGSWYAA